MKIHQIYTHNELRNFTYIIELGNKAAIVIDPWDAIFIEQWLTERNLSLKTIINTHEHWDHTQGNSALVKQYQCEVWAHQNGEGKIPELTRTLKANELIDIEAGVQFLVLDTPGHTFAHLCFLVKIDGVAQAVFTGDTLFNAGVGHCRSGNADVLYQTITEHFNTLPDNVLVYPGHDYLQNNLKFTLKFEPSNEDARSLLKKVEVSDYQPGDVKTTIGSEKSFNTFLRLGNQEIISNLELVNPQPKQVFLKLRSLRDNW